MEQIIAGGGSKDPGAAAARLIEEFETFPAVLTGSSRRLLRASLNDVPAVQAIRRFQRAMMHALNVQVSTRPVLSNWEALINYLRADMGHRTTEWFRVLHLNTRNILIRDEVMSRGTIDQSAVHVREVIHRAMDLGSASILLVHNHPSGDTAASRADIDITRAVIEAAERLGIVVHDHLIIGANGYRSMRTEGLI